MNGHTVPGQLGRYRIDGVLGQGAMAVVYAGFDPQIGREVAIKCLHREAAAGPEERRRFRAEAQAAGRLTHPHIVTVFDAGETPDGRAFLAMERLPGDTLASRVARDGLPPPGTVLALAVQLASALDYAHAHGVIHHDIKPENIMLAQGWQHAKLADFGIAERRAVGGDTGSATVIGGTPAYMAPERLDGAPTDARGDLFSLGVVLYWLLAGTLPWPETSDVHILRAQRRALARPPLEPRDPATPSILVDIVQTLLAPAPADRYQRSAELVEDLQLARREFDRQRPGPLASRIVSLRLRWAALLGGVLCLTLALGMGAIYVTQRDAVTGLALDYGSSLARMVAGESAEDLLLGDRAATRALVEDIAGKQQIHYLAIADRHGAVVASTRPGDIGRAIATRAGARRLPGGGEVDAYTARADGDTDAMLLFDAPIQYQAARVGTLRLGVSRAPLQAAQRTALGVLAAVLAATLLIVVGVAYLLFRRLLAPLTLLGDAMLRLARGDPGYRIRLNRRDEVGRLFAAFNLMADSLPTGPQQQTPAARPAATEASQPTRLLPRAACHDGRAETD